jgi:uncharacterized membrane protein YdjX (TVP38/TMEM64 family)
MKALLEKESSLATKVRLILWVFMILMLILLSFAWRFTPLGKLIDIENILSSSLFFDSRLRACLAVVFVYTISGLVAFPIVILIPATAFVFGPAEGFCYSLIALFVNATVLYMLGYYFNQKTIAVLQGNRLHKVRQILSRHSFLAIVFSRLLPAAPYTVTNLLAGAFHIPFMKYAAGTIIGIAPSVIIMTVVGDQFKIVLEKGVSKDIIVLSVVAFLIVAMVVLFWKQLCGIRTKK